MKELAAPLGEDAPRPLVMTVYTLPVPEPHELLHGSDGGDVPGRAGPQWGGGGGHCSSSTLDWLEESWPRVASNRAVKSLIATDTLH